MDMFFCLFSFFFSFLTLNIVVTFPVSQYLFTVSNKQTRKAPYSIDQVYLLLTSSKHFFLLTKHYGKQVQSLYGLVL